MEKCLSKPYTHTPVLLSEVLALFQGKKLKTFYEGTVGAAGHASQLLEQHPEVEKYVACDRDGEALSLAEKNLAPWKGKVSFVHDNFVHLDKHLEKGEEVDGFLFDLGVSSMQLDNPERGFSFQREGPLDMRMDPTQGESARDVLNRMSAGELTQLFRELGEEPRARRIAETIVAARRRKRIETTTELAALIAEVSPRRGRLHPATLVFQALRIFVNRELETLKEALGCALSRLAPGGRVGVISFHSLEDRIVKQFFREETMQKRRVEPPFLLKLLTKKPIMARFAEERMNPRARSARLRAVERVMT